MNRVIVVGAARSGVAAANYLARQGVPVVITDSRLEVDLPLARELSAQVERLFGSHPESLLEDAEMIVLSPGVPASLPFLAAARAKSIPVISEIELAFGQLTGRVIAVTGSNGKSTTTALIGSILSAAGRDPIVAGNIGQPLISAVDEKPRDYVIELSSFQLETIDSFRADVALLLNITPDHMDRYDSIDDYAAAKYRIFRNQQPEDVAVVNADDPRTSSPPTPARLWRFSSSRVLDRGGYLDGESLVVAFSGQEEEISRSVLSLPGVANSENALAAWLAARAVGVDRDAVERGFTLFEGLPHRMVLVREIDGVQFVNDSKGTNVDATIKSLEGLPDGQVVLILGGKDKEGEFERLRNLVSRKARLVITIGSAADKIAWALQGAAPLEACGDMKRAVLWAWNSSQPGDTVLLSPACASFDQYQNFEERGKHFEELVRAL
jgi:UDP-N-acetylmuramoylalanine--D-glutamate ligase